MFASTLAMTPTHPEPIVDTAFGAANECLISNISYGDFMELRAKDGAQSRKAHENLDHFRAQSISKVLEQRRAKGCPFLEKTEL